MPQNRVAAPPPALPFFIFPGNVLTEILEDHKGWVKIPPVEFCRILLVTLHIQNAWQKS